MVNNQKNPHSDSYTVDLLVDQTHQIRVLPKEGEKFPPELQQGSLINSQGVFGIDTDHNPETAENLFLGADGKPLSVDVLKGKVKKVLETPNSDGFFPVLEGITLVTARKQAEVPVVDKKTVEMISGEPVEANRQDIRGKIEGILSPIIILGLAAGLIHQKLKGIRVQKTMARAEKDRAFFDGKKDDELKRANAVVEKLGDQVSALRIKLNESLSLEEQQKQAIASGDTIISDLKMEKTRWEANAKALNGILSAKENELTQLQAQLDKSMKIIQELRAILIKKGHNLDTEQQKEIFLLRKQIAELSRELQQLTTKTKMRSSLPLENSRPDVTLH
ncbi:MAG: hypothetical protein UT55_C0064G0003 [Candidatus Peregrinibacteria bacterium GW2011_GWE2_39_6]|nr:MAG: hypothetical protein UT36_C0007G0046 [Candidatus Peregrinibacteria bacterium GW2011_GWF2_39_17]KKR24376.1 MAG: hypothetical protein UT55_C0064G0003 [Candidatus Peregrinibacteria bacterium GW2011_GWE2_39_6]HCW31887.1 hypothetical protein [Candidatus Peregrinibacteria bacterium]